MTLHFSFRYLTLILLLAVATTATAQDVTPRTLQQCIDDAMRRSNRLSASRQSVRIAESAAGESRATRWPTLGVGGTYNYTSEVQELSIQLPIPGLTMPKIEFGDGNVYDFTLNARAPLYAGGALVEKARADAVAAYAYSEDLAADSLRLLWDVRRAYFNATGAEARAEAARKSAARLARHLEELTRAQQVGTVANEAVLATTARLRQAEGLVLTSEADARTARLSLGYLAADAGTEITPAEDNGEALADEIPDPLLSSRVRPELAALSARITQNKHLSRAAKGSLLPSLSGVAMYHYGKPGVEMVKNEWMDYYTVGLSASWTLWDWRARSHRIDQTRAAVTMLEARRDDLANSFSTQYQSASSLLSAARAAHMKATERVSLETERLALVEGRMRQGMATESEYLDAQDDLTSAHLDQVSATVRVRIAEADLLNASGR